MNEWVNPRERERHKLGICVRCGEHDAAPGILRCQNCRKHSSRVFARYKKAFTPEKYSHLAALTRKRLAERKAKGLCLQCQEPVSGFQLCKRCRVMSSEAKRRWRLRKKGAAA